MVMKNVPLCLLLATTTLVSLPSIRADDAAGDDYYYQAAAGDDAGQDDDYAAQADDAMQNYYYDNLNDDDAYGAGDDYIKYWTDYALLPKRCIV